MLSQRFTAAVFCFVLVLLSLNAEAVNQVDTQWLAQHLLDKDLLLIDMDDDFQYQRFHIPGAIHLPYQALNRTNRRGVSYSAGREHLVKLLGMVGATADSHIVIYDDLGGLNAGRLLWELERLGHKKISIVEGGLVQWILDGRKVTNKAYMPKKTVYQAGNTNGLDNLANLDDITRLSKDSVLLDVRSQQEYSGHPRQKRSGHIPGAHWLPWDENVDFENGFKLKAKAELMKKLDSLGISKTTPIYVYCQSGQRASQAYYTLRQLGFNKVKLYDGSMAEYSIRKDLPLKKGMQP